MVDDERTTISVRTVVDAQRACEAAAAVAEAGRVMKECCRGAGG